VTRTATNKKIQPENSDRKK